MVSRNGYKGSVEKKKYEILIVLCYLSSYIVVNVKMSSLITRKLEVVEMRFYRRLRNITQTDRVINNEVLNKIAAEGIILFGIKKGQLKSFGLIMKKMGFRIIKQSARQRRKRAYVNGWRNQKPGALSMGGKTATSHKGWEDLESHDHLYAERIRYIEEK